MNPLQALLFFWKEYIMCKATELKLRVVFWYIHRTQAEASAAIIESREWSKTLTPEEAKYLYGLMLAGEKDLKTALTVMRARAHKPSTDLKGWQ